MSNEQKYGTWSGSSANIALAVRYALLVSILFIAKNVFAGDAPFFKGDVQSQPAPHGLPKYEQNVGIDQHLGQNVDLSLPVRDENGNTTTLGSYFGKLPVILVMAYYECPNLCTMVMNGVFASTRATGFIPGKDFEVVSVSINPHESAKLALDKKNSYLAGYHEQDNANGFHFLTADEPVIEALTKEVGFRYNYDSESHQFAHASGIMVATPDGKLSKYFMGVQFNPKDLKFALMDASSGAVGTLAEKLVLFCYQCAPSDSKYGLAVAKLLKIGGTLMILAIIGMYVYFQRRSRKLKLASHA